MGPTSPIAEVVLPSGLPAWITPALVRLTLQTWQPYYATPLTVGDAVRMIADVGRLFDVLSQGTSHETIRSTGASE